MKKIKVYLGGALFNEAEINQRKKEAKLIREKLGDKVELYNPIEAPFNENKDKSKPSPVDIFYGDYNELKDSDFIICDITREDPGLMAELGIAYQLNIPILAVDSDIRRSTANMYDIPSYSLNHFVLGMINDGGNVFASFSAALNDLSDTIDDIY